jgi:hypothetical protein
MQCSGRLKKHDEPEETSNYQQPVQLEMPASHGDARVDVAAGFTRVATHKVVECFWRR